VSLRLDHFKQIPRGVYPEVQIPRFARDDNRGARDDLRSLAETCLNARSVLEVRSDRGTNSGQQDA
jgi:hypothetical protein